MSDLPRLTKKPPRWWVNHVMKNTEPGSRTPKAVADEIRLKWQAFCEVARVWRQR